MKRKWSLFVGVLVTVLTLTSAILGQQQREVMVQRETVVVPDGQGKTPSPDRTFTFVSSEMNFDGKLVKGAPYSAQAVTETTQTFVDGNRIINKSESAFYRDSEGRTRREQSLRSIGPFATSGDTPQAIFINDPVAGVNYSLDSRTMVARKMLPMKFDFKFDTGNVVKIATTTGVSVGVGTGTATTISRTVAPDRIEVHPEVIVTPAPMPAGGEGHGVVMQWHGGPDQSGKSESLGKQIIEGIEAEGTRNVTIIPAGKIGNERAIEIVFERWYSPELQTVVMTRQSDPRFGETTYRLTNISRDEPARSLFEVPAGYTVKEATTTYTGTTTSDKQINGGVLNGKAINMPIPEYPAIAKQANATGAVNVQVMLDESGNVISATAVSGHPLLRAAAVAAAKQAKFTPTRLSGQPVKISGILVYNFAQ